VRSQAEKGAAFRALHEGPPFVIPNAWDAGSARVLESLGFKAVATTSSGFAFTLGRSDGNVTLDEKAEHIGQMSAATSIPVSADLEDGYGPRPEDAAEAIRRAAAAGAVGGSIEDWSREGRLIDVGEAAERIAAAAEVARGLGFPFTLTARAEGQLRDGPGLDDTIARLIVFEDAGADVVFAPGLRTIEEVRAVCDAMSRPVNVLGHAGFDSVEALFDAGAQRVSVGGALTWVAGAALRDAAEALREGDLSVLKHRSPLA
jgi:2-methylisocitrate lyase-like PEP mutase family enzyme